MRTIAITGASGFLGKHLMRHFSTVEGTVALAVEREVRQDAAQWELWLQRHKPDVVIHCAGYADVRKSINNPWQAFRVNVTDTLTLLERLEGRNCVVIYVATDKVFGDQEGCHRSTEYRPLNAYDASKVAAEVAVKDFQKRNACVIARFPNFYGPDDGHKERLVPMVVDAIKRKDRVFRVRTNGQQTRQYIFIEDAVRCIERCINNPGAAASHHFGTRIVKSVRQVIEDIGERFMWRMELQCENLSGEASRLSLALDTPFNVFFTDWKKSLDSLV